MSKSKMLPVVAKAAKAAGGTMALCEKIGVRRQSLYQWRKVPAERVLQIEAATNGAVTRYEMRPDIYPDAA